jgi:outer membrane protein assembly factor BamB
LHPLLVGNQLIRHTGQAIEAFDFQSGRPVWSQPSEASGNGGSLEDRLWNEAAFGTLASDGQRLYIVERCDVAAAEIDPDTGEEVALPTLVNILTARDVAEPRQGNLRWRVGGQNGLDESSLAGTLFLGPPLPMAGRLYALADVKQAIRLVVLDAATGRLEWSQDLADVEPAAMIGRLRRAAGATPSIADEIVVCPTSGGGVIAVNLVTQSLLWAYRYACATPTRPDPQTGTRVDLGQGGRWLDGHATIAEGRVVLSPLESQQVHCLELDSGKPLWRQPRGQYLYVAGIQAGRVVLVGKSQVTALKLNDGTPAWSVPLVLPPGSQPSGRGLLANVRYFLPLSTAEIAEIDLTTGRIVGTSRSLKQIVPGNLAWHRQAMVSLGTRCLEVFDELAPLETQLRERLARRPDDAAAVARLGEIELAAGRIEQALDQFRRAHQLQATPRHRNLLVAALHDALRGKPENRPELEAELDRLLP